MLQQYRLRFYEDDNYEVESDRIYLIALDLDGARALAIAESELQRARLTFARRRGLDARATERVRASVYTHPEGEYVMDALA